MCFDLLDDQGRVMINPLMDIPPMRKSKDALHHIEDLRFSGGLEF